MSYDKSYVTEEYHGGRCCGMSHIYLFPPNPSFELEERQKRSGTEQATFVRENPCHIKTVNDEYPAQTAGERLKQMMENIEKGILGVRMARPRGIIEVVLTTGQCYEWQELLTEIGFKEVNRCVNSNSNNTIVVFHKNSGQ